MPYPLGKFALRSGALRRVAVILRQAKDGPSPGESPHRGIFESALRAVRATGATPVIERRALAMGEGGEFANQLAVLGDGSPPGGKDTGGRDVFGPSEIDLAVVLGGDGTLLHAASIFSPAGTDCPPLLPVGLGTIGAMLPFTWAEAEVHIARIAREGFALVHGMPRLSCSMQTMDDDGKLVKKDHVALNDLVIYRGSFPHTVSLSLSLGDHHLLNLQGDGVIISTTAGSTGYSLSAGGPLLHPSIDAFCVTPINARTLAARSLILPGKSEVTVKVTRAQAQGIVSVDSLQWGGIGLGGTVSVRKAEGEVPIVARDSSSITGDWLHNVHKHITTKG